MKNTPRKQSTKRKRERKPHAKDRRSVRAQKRIDPEVRAPPKRMSEDELDEWARFWRSAQVGHLRMVDMPTVEAYCEARAEWREARQHISDHGIVVRTATGVVIASPYIRVRDEALTRIQRLLVDLGLTPGLRHKLAIPGVDRLAAFAENERADGGAT